MALYVKYDCVTCENKNCTGHGLPTTEKVCDGYKHTVTKADRIRAMSDEELALFIHNAEAQAIDTEIASTVEGWLDWLKQEATE